MTTLPQGCSARHANTDLSPAEMLGPLLVAWCVEGKACLVVGGGKISARRVRTLLAAGGQVQVVAPWLHPEIRARALRHEIHCEERGWRPSDLDGVELVLVAIDDPRLSAEIAVACRARGLWVHVADRPELCDFIFPALHREGPIQVAVSTGGLGPGMAARVRDRIALSLPRNLQQATERFGALRRAIRQAAPQAEASASRMTWLAEWGRKLSLDELAGLDEATIQGLVERFERNPQEKKTPKVFLVGAGPGDPELLTLAAIEALSQADLVISDRLVPAALLERIRGEIRIADKRPGRSRQSQSEIHGWMLEGVRAHQTVVRLKCGDPFLFGRGAEEVDFLGRHGIEVEVVSGLSSALAAPAAAGISLTSRHVSDRVLLLTARGADGRTVDLPSFREDQTCVFLMALGSLESLTSRLLALGYPADWPAALVSKATHPEQRSLTCALVDLPKQAAEAGLSAPAVLVIGRVITASQAEEVTAWMATA